MKKQLLILLLLLSLNAFSQQDAWVYFMDKPNSDTFYSNPLLMLSQRALDRRNIQNISLDSKDIPIHQPYVDQIESVQGIQVMAKSKWMNAVHVRGTTIDIQSLVGLSFVASIDFADKSLNSNRSVKGNSETNIVLVNKNLDAQVVYNYGNSGNQIQMLNGHLLHQQNFTGSRKIIAVLDSGFPGVNTAQPFARLLDNNKILGGYNFVDRNTNFYALDSHGTLVLSTMGGYVENQLVGTAPDASYYLFVTENAASENPIEESLWVEAAEMADSLGVDVINTSLGYFTYDNPNYSHTYSKMNGISTFISRGADIAFSRGMVVVVSAGNSGGTSNPNISAPADALNVLSVGAVNASKQYVSFSSIGPSFDNRVKPDVMAQGLSAVVSNTSGNITTANGTSFSGPITAGMVASLWQALPNRTNTEIVQLIKQSSSFYNNPNSQYGYGIPDFNLALANALPVNEIKTNKFQVFPNPTINEITFNFPEGIATASLKIYNTLGALILQETLVPTSKTVSLGNYSQGIYFYNLATNGFSQSGKIIKQ